MGSDPGLATPEKGGELVKLAAAGLIEALAEFVSEAPAGDGGETPSA
jgi:creatinine amidohydrolase/Fe(II)-dependent formamide hydrolase-like protein